MVTSAKQWKGKREAGNVELTLPSENVCLVRRLQPEAFLTSGLIPDSLSAMVQEAIRSKKGLPPDALQKITDDPKKLRQAMQMTDEVVCYVVVEPIVEMPPKCEYEMAGGKICDEYVDTDDKRHDDKQHPDFHPFREGARDEDTLYVDEVSLDDKNFIFQYAMGGTADVKRFREEFGSNVAGLSNRKNVSGKGKRSSRRK
jgi:hypothetical protein